MTVSDVGLADFLQTLHDGVAVIGQDMRMKYFNERLVQVLDLDQGDVVLGMHMADLLQKLAQVGKLGPAEGRTPEEIVAERLANWGTESARVERRAMPNGRVLDIYRTPTINEDIISIHVDVTDTVRAAEEIERQRNYMESLLENAADGVSLLDGAGNFMMYNTRLLEMYNIDPEKVHWGMDYLSFAEHFGDLADLTPERKAEEIQNRYRFAFDPNVTSLRRDLANGRTLLISKRILPDGGCVMTYRDITQELEREREMTEARIEAEESSRHKSDFVARMSHEMRTPLNGILGIAALLQQTELEGRQQDLVNVIASSGKVLLRLIDDILDLSKIDAETFELVEDELDISQLLHECVSIMRPAAADKGLELRAIAPDVPVPRLRGDTVRIKQIVLNLMTNAVKFTEDGWIEVSLEAERGPEGVTLTFGITDTGVGIAADKLDQIFNRFYQIDGTATRKYGGAGLGLAITQKLVDAMGGAIQVSSEMGKGTTFRIRLTLPLARLTRRSPTGPALLG